MSTQPDNSPPASLVLLLAALAMFGPFSIDTIFPAFPNIEAALHVGPVEMQQTISVYLLSYALMSLLHGPLSDSLGRRPVIMAGVVVFIIASIGCAYASTIWQLLGFRCLQGVSAGSGLIVGRAIIRDRFAGADAQRVMSRVTLVFGIAPAAAPIIGGIIATRFGWEAIFWFLALFSVLLLAASWRWLPETHPKAARISLEPRALFTRYWHMLCNPAFLLLAASGSLNFAALFLYIASAPVFVLQHMRLGPTQFGYLFVPVIGGMMLGAFFSGRLAGRHQPAFAVNMGYRVMLAGGVINIAYCLAVREISWPWAVLPVMLQGFGISLSFPTLTLLLLDLYPHERGSASSMQSFISLLLSAVIAGVISPLLARAPLHLAAGTLLCALSGLATWRLYGRVLPRNP